MHGNTPYSGHSGQDADRSAEEVETLRRDSQRVAARTRDLLTDEFIVGSELREGMNGPQATVAVQPPIGELVTAGVPPDATDDEHAALVHELAAGAAIQVKRAVGDIPPMGG